jgi:hypothetical protein
MCAIDAHDGFRQFFAGYGLFDHQTNEDRQGGPRAGADRLDGRHSLIACFRIGILQQHQPVTQRQAPEGRLLFRGYRLLHHLRQFSLQLRRALAQPFHLQSQLLHSLGRTFGWNRQRCRWQRLWPAAWTQHTDAEACGRPDQQGQYQHSLARCHFPALLSPREFILDHDPKAPGIVSGTARRCKIRRFCGGGLPGTNGAAKKASLRPGVTQE